MPAVSWYRLVAKQNPRRYDFFVMQETFSWEYNASSIFSQNFDFRARRKNLKSIILLCPLERRNGLLWRLRASKIFDSGIKYAFRVLQRYHLLDNQNFLLSCPRAEKSPRNLQTIIYVKAKVTKEQVVKACFDFVHVICFLGRTWYNPNS